MTRRIILFLILNFGALGIGGFLMGNGPLGDWYSNLNQAPWTPPGWVFGAAWTSIMLCFSFYMAKAYELILNKKLLIILFITQWMLNVSWNPAFFYFHQVLIGLMIIIVLTLLIGIFIVLYSKKLGIWSILILPYFIWLCIATSLNYFIYLYN